MGGLQADGSIVAALVRDGETLQLVAWDVTRPERRLWARASLPGSDGGLNSWSSWENLEFTADGSRIVGTLKVQVGDRREARLVSLDAATGRPSPGPMTKASTGAPALDSPDRRWIAAKKEPGVDSRLLAISPDGQLGLTRSEEVWTSGETNLWNGPWLPVWDLVARYPVSDRLWQGRIQPLDEPLLHVMAGGIDADGWLRTLSDDGRLRAWYLGGPTVAESDWILPMAEVLCGMEMGIDQTLRELSPSERSARLNLLQRDLLKAGDDPGVRHVQRLLQAVAAR